MAISRWTTQKGIDIFSKRMIFLPINQGKHWSLCIVINPGLINISITENHQEVPCLLFLDSLRVHDKESIAKNIRLWLNHEHRKFFGSTADVFTTSSMKLFSPKGNEVRS